MNIILKSLDYNYNDAIMPSTFSLFGVLTPLISVISGNEIPVYLFSHSIKYCISLELILNVYRNNKQFSCSKTC